MSDETVYYDPERKVIWSPDWDVRAISIEQAGISEINNYPDKCYD